jgi:hypothetical protein
MTPIDTFDADKLLEHVLPRIRNALENWQRGMAADEPSLMNQITSQFSTRRSRTCDVGKLGKLSIETNIYELHRKGPQSKDKFGSDLAITISTEGAQKTCFIQFKCAESDKVKLEHNQLRDASIHHVDGRAFVLCVNRKNETIRLQLTNKLLESFPSGQDSSTFNTDTWMSFHKWLIDWLSCDVGLPSDTSSGPTIERMLRSFFINTTENPFRMWQFPEEYAPSRAWLSVSAHRYTENEANK